MKWFICIFLDVENIWKSGIEDDGFYNIMFFILGDLFGIEVDCKGIIIERLIVLCYLYKFC